MISDWRLDSLSGGHGGAPGGIVCGEAPSIQLLDNVDGHNDALAGGGAGFHNSIPLHTLCRKHVVVANGRVFDRGFVINEGAMTLEASFTIPAVGKTFVLGFGGVKRRRPLMPLSRLSDYPDDPFPRPDGVSFGSHPYSELNYIAGGNGSASPVKKDRRFATYANYITESGYVSNPSHRFILPQHSTSGALMNVTGAQAPWIVRISPYVFLRYDTVIIKDRGQTIPDASRYIIGLRVVRVNLMDRTTQEIAYLENPDGFTGRNSVFARCFSIYNNKLFPVGGDEFVAFPMYDVLPVVRINVNDPLNFKMLPGTAWRLDAPVIENFWDTKNLSGSDLSATSLNNARTNRPFRLHDGRYLVLPRFKTNSMCMYIYNPMDDTVDRKDPLALGLFLEGSNGGTSRWKAPVQASTGTVCALPDVFPGNTSLLYYPDEDRFERAITTAYPRADIQHAIGQPTADGRILYWQTYGAAVDINSLLTVWPDELAGGVGNNDRRYTISILEGLQKSVLAAFDYGLTVSDGVFLFGATPYGARSNWNTTSYYSSLALDPYTMDYQLYKYPIFTDMSVAITSDMYYTIDNSIYNDQKLFLTPEFDWIAYRNWAAYSYTMHDAPATKSMGAFFRQAYFGYCF